MASTFQRAGALGMSYVPIGQGSANDEQNDAHDGGAAYGAAAQMPASPPRNRIANTGALGLAPEQYMSHHLSGPSDGGYSIESYSIQPLKQGGGLGAATTPLESGGDPVSGGGGRRGRRHQQMATSSSTSEFGSESQSSQVSAEPSYRGAAEERKRQLEQEVKRLEQEILGVSKRSSVADTSGGNLGNDEANASGIMFIDGTNSNHEITTNIHSNSNSSKDHSSDSNRSKPKVAMTTEEKSRAALEEALEVMKMQNKMLAERIERSEHDSQRALEEEVERRTAAALAEAKRKSEAEKHELLELERGKRLLAISQIEDEAAAKLKKEEEDRETLEEERIKLEGRLKRLELAEKRREMELLEEQKRVEDLEARRASEQKARESELREFEESRKKLMDEIVQSEQEKAKATIQAEMERLEKEYKDSLKAAEDVAKARQEEHERLANAKLQEETSRVRSEVTGQFEKEHARLLQLQEQSQKELEREREDMRKKIKEMEAAKESIISHMRESEEKAREELVLAELTKSEYLANMQKMERQQNGLQQKIQALDSKKDTIDQAKTAAAASGETNLDSTKSAEQIEERLSAERDERMKLEAAFKELEQQKQKLAQTLSESEEASKRNQEELAKQIAAEKTAMEEKLKTMEKEKENMASHLASTLKENQSRTAVIEEKMEAEKEELRRAMEQRDQEKLEVLLKLQRNQTEAEVGKIERELLKRQMEEMTAEAKSTNTTKDEKNQGSDKEGKDAAEEKKEASTKTSDETVDESAAGKVAETGSGSDKLKALNKETAEQNAAAERLAEEHRLLLQRLETFAKEKEELAEKLAMAERTAKARQDLAIKSSNREKEELKLTVQRMREELKAEKEAAAAAAAAAATELSANSAAKGGSPEPEHPTLTSKRSLYDMIEGQDSATEDKGLQLPRTLSKVINQAMPHTIEAIPEGEEPDDVTDVFGIDSDEETMMSRVGSGASLGSRIRREKASAAAKVENTAAAVAAAKEGKEVEKQTTLEKPSPTQAEAPVNPFEDLPAPHAAAAGGDLTRLKVLGKLESSLLSSFDGAQRCPLFYAVAYGQEDVTAYLVEMAPDTVDSIDAHGDTPVHAAASGGNVHCLRSLLQCKEVRAKARAKREWEARQELEGGDVSQAAYDSHYNAHKDSEVADPRNAMQMTPSHLARTPDVLEVLYGYGADMSAVDSNGRSPLFVSCAMNRESCTEYIIQCLDRECKTEELYEKDNRGDTPLHAAACNGSVECLLLLLQFGVDPTVSNTKGLKAIDLAARNNQAKCRNLLAEYHLHFCTSSEFDSVLFLATLEGHRQVKASEAAGDISNYEIIKKKSSFSGAPAGAAGGGLKHVQSMFSLKTNKSLRLQRWGEWIAYEDQQTEKIYWYNSTTSKGQWEKPVAVAKLQNDPGGNSGSPGQRTLHSKKSMRLKKYGDWIEYVTDTSQTFFYNEKNGEFQWHAPPGHPKHNPNSNSSASSPAKSPEKTVAQVMLSEASEPTAEAEETKNGPETSEWQPYKDPDSGSIFWYNTTTHVSQWECPFDDIDFEGGMGADGKAGDAGHGSDDDEAVEVMGDDDLGI